MAILLVLAQHVRHFTPAGTLGRLDSVVSALVGQGYMGVDVFFALSGYLITGALLADHGSGRVPRFYVRRALRIWPLYLATLAILTLLAVVWPSVAPQDASDFHADLPWFWTHTINVRFAARAMAGDIAWFDGGPFATTHMWSLAVEEQFYLVWPILVFSTPRPSLAGRCAWVLTGGVLLRATLLAAGVPSLTLHMLMPTHLDGLVGGAMFAALPYAAPSPPTQALQRAVAKLAEASTPRRWGVPLIGALVYVVAGADARSLQLVGLPVFSLSVAVFVAVCATARDTGVLAHGALRAVGRVSYGLYLLHMPTLFFVGRWLRVAHPTWPGWWQPIGGVAATAMLVYGSWRYWETPWLALKRYVPREGVAAHAIEGAS